MRNPLLSFRANARNPPSRYPRQALPIFPLRPAAPSAVGTPRSVGAAGNKYNKSDRSDIPSRSLRAISRCTLPAASAWETHSTPRNHSLPEKHTARPAPDNTFPAKPGRPGLSSIPTAKSRYRPFSPYGPRPRVRPASDPHGVPQRGRRLAVAPDAPKDLP